MRDADSVSGIRVAYQKNASTFVRFYASTSLEDRVDERRERRAVREHEQRADEEQHDEDRQQPELLPDPHVGPQLAENSALLRHVFAILELVGHVGAAAR